MSGLRDPWFDPGPAEAARLLSEARREIKPGHELYGVDLRFVAACKGCDDTVFGCGDGSFAVVHLSYQSNERPPWPSTTRAGGFIAIEMVMDQHEH